MRFFFDNNLSPNLAHAINELIKDFGHEAFHLKDKYNDGSIKDIVWLRDLKAEQDLVIITGDVMISKNPTEIQALQESGKTIFFLKKGWTHIDPWIQCIKFLQFFKEIEKLATRSPQGSCFLVPLHGQIEKT